MYKGTDLPDPIQRPQSVLSVAETITTTTSIADFEDSLSTVTTPRGGSPVRFGNGNLDLPPSYDESQAAHIGERSEPQYPEAPGVAAHSVQQVFRTEIPHRSLSDDPHSHLHNEAGHVPLFQGSPLTHPGSSALLYQALSFTKSPAPATQSTEYVQHLTRPIAIPSLPPSTNSPPTIAGVRFARFNARALNGASITPAQHASFIDGLNAVSTASGFDASQLHETAPFRMDAGSGGIPREEWVRAYVQLCNERFFQPRGLHVAITTLHELATLAKVPEQRGFRESVVSDVLDAAAEAANNDEDGEDALTKAAANAAAKLDPYIEPLGMMIPAMSRDSEAMDHVARGLASFSLDEKMLPPPPPTLHRSATDQPPTRALNKFWNPMGMGPISMGPTLPPLPRTQLSPQASWHMWGEDFGKRFEQWGNEYGKRWDNWGRDYGKAWEEWGDGIQRKFSGPSSSTVNMIPGAGASMESFNTSSSKGSKKGKARQQSGAGQEERNNDHVNDNELDDDDDDTLSISSDSSTSSDGDWSDPEANYVKRLANIEESAEKARIEGKRDITKIEKERESALRKAEVKRIKDESHLENKLKKREIKRHTRKFKRDVRNWKKDFKKITKQLHRKPLSHQEMRAQITEKRAEFEKMRAEWAVRRMEIYQKRHERGTTWREAREHRRDRHLHRRPGHGHHGADCGGRGRRERRNRHQRDEQPKSERFLTDENMLWVVIRNLE